MLCAGNKTFSTVTLSFFKQQSRQLSSYMTFLGSNSYLEVGLLTMWINPNNTALQTRVKSRLYIHGKFPSVKKSSPKISKNMTQKHLHLSCVLTLRVHDHIVEEGCRLHKGPHGNRLEAEER